MMRSLIPRSPRLREAVLASIGILGVLTTVKHGAHALPGWSGAILVLATAYQLYLPLWRIDRHGVTHASLGLQAPRWSRDIPILFTTTLLVGIGYSWITDQLMTAGGWVWVGSLPPALGERIVTELLVIALPEELFFRGYLLERWTQSPHRRHVWTAILTSSLIFALAHYVGEYNPVRLATFFPGLVFGCLRWKTRSLAIPVIFHAFCNLLALLLNHGYRPS